MAKPPTLTQAIIGWEGSEGWLLVDVKGAGNKWPVDQALYMRCEMKNWYATADYYAVTLTGTMTPEKVTAWVWMEPGETGSAIFEPFMLEEGLPYYTLALRIHSTNHPPMDPQEMYVFDVNKGMGLAPLMIVGAMAAVAVVVSTRSTRRRA